MEIGVASSLSHSPLHLHSRLLSKSHSRLLKPSSSLLSKKRSSSSSSSSYSLAAKICHARVKCTASSFHRFLRQTVRPGWARACLASDQQQGQVGEGDVVDGNVLPFCSIDKKQKKTIGDLEQDFIEALQSFYYDKTATMSNEEFDNLKEELMWEGSSVVMLSKDEQRFLEASMAYVAGKSIMTDAEFDELKLALKKEGSSIIQEGPRCSLRTRKVYSDLSVDYFKMFLLNVPAAVVALTLFFFLDDLTGFEITYLLELPEPFSFIFTWFAALPLIVWSALVITSAIIKDFLILKGPCPNCGTENVSFFGTILTIPSGGSTNTLKCSNCGTNLNYDAGARLITLPEPSEA